MITYLQIYIRNNDLNIWIKRFDRLYALTMALSDLQSFPFLTYFESLDP